MTTSNHEGRLIAVYHFKDGKVRIETCQGDKGDRQLVTGFIELFPDELMQEAYGLIAAATGLECYELEECLEPKIEELSEAFADDLRGLEGDLE
ncbi:MAG: hypothetical protein WCS15_06145 [Prevotella sp.]